MRRGLDQIHWFIDLNLVVRGHCDVIISCSELRNKLTAASWWFWFAAAVVVVTVTKCCCSTLKRLFTLRGAEVLTSSDIFSSSCSFWNKPKLPKVQTVSAEFYFEKLGLLRSSVLILWSGRNVPTLVKLEMSRWRSCDHQEVQQEVQQEVRQEVQQEVQLRDVALILSRLWTLKSAASNTESMSAGPRRRHETSWFTSVLKLICAII